MDWDPFDAVLFDLDGVITPTSEVHRRAWAQMFDEFLAARGEPPYRDADYFAYIDGKPRLDGVRSFLASRGIELPEGAAHDPPEAETVHGLGTRKNAVFARVLSEAGVEPYPGSVRLLDELGRTNMKFAVVSSSRNAPGVLTAAGLADRFTDVVDGSVAAARGLAGKPAPDTFLAAADDLGVPKERAIVVEDAISGVEAGRAGGFGLVIGVDRGVGEAALREHGADVVVRDLAELL
jgi:beta-phosphoglucomutase family hydrolase